MTSTLVAIDAELLEEVMVEVFDSPVWDKIEDYNPEIREQAKIFCNELNDIGITNCEDWSNRFYGTALSNVQFLEEMLYDNGELQDIPTGIVIDWEASWERNYRFDFNVIPCGKLNWYFHNS
tara:strand:- start:848 stop:1213 length:366 start_codon:yes stop_codon:yes gene_type:complete